MILSTPLTQRRELADFVRSQREKLNPREVGLPGGARRRTPHLNDPAIHRLVEDLSERSDVFKRYWHERVVLGREGGERTFDHPVEGFLRYEQVTFALAGHPDLKLTILIGN